MKDRVVRLAWLALLGFAIAEVAAHVVTRARVADPADWRRAAELVRSEWRAGDLVTAAPSWSDPLARQVLGDRIDLAMAGRSDTAAYARLWALVIRDARPPEAPRRAPDLERRFGRVAVKRWTLDPPTVSYDFVARLRDAEVSWSRPDGERPCPWSRFPPPRGGGLGFGVLDPVARFACDARRGSPWVAAVVMEDLDLAARHCVRQAPAGGDTPVRVRYRDVPLGERIVFHGGLYYEDERMREGAPVIARVRLGGEVAATMTHMDGDGWKSMVIDTRRRAGSQAEVAVEVISSRPTRRGFCWAATVRARQDVHARAPATLAPPEHGGGT